MTGSFDDKVVLITGAGSGIGRATAALFAQVGAQVVGVDLNEEALNETMDQVRAEGGEMSAIIANLQEEDSVARTFAEVKSAHGRLDVLHNCVGGSTGRDAAVHELELETFDAVVALEIRTAFLGSKYAIPLLRAAGGGAVVNMSSYVAFRGVSEIHAYSASKGAVASLTRAMAGTYAKDGIRVNAIAPGIALTERARARLEDPNVSGRLTFSWDDYPFALGEPGDIGHVVVFLASDGAKMITGQVIMADGGLTAY